MLSPPAYPIKPKHPTRGQIYVVQSTLVARAARGYTTRGTAGAVLGGGSARWGGGWLLVVTTCHYVKNIDHSTNYFIPEVLDSDSE